jgi:uncharacterized protein (DUF58 family)
VEATELLKRVRRIEIKTRGLTKQVFAGEYHSAFKGRGISFSEVREYQYGDDVRSIDWNVTARFNHPYVKVYEEERELTVVLLIDVSGSGFFGSARSLKKELITEIAAVLSFSAISNNDKIGIIFFSDRVEKYIPPQKGRKHILRIIRELLNFEPVSQKSDLNETLRFLTNVLKKRCSAFIISDFRMNSFEESLKIASGKHDIAALTIFDPLEAELPNVGMMRIIDRETSTERWIDTSSNKTRTAYASWFNEHRSRLKSVFPRCGVDYTTISTAEDYVKPLLRLFKER